MVIPTAVLHEKRDNNEGTVGIFVSTKFFKMITYIKKNEYNAYESQSYWLPKYNFSDCPLIIIQPSFSGHSDISKFG